MPSGSTWSGTAPSGPSLLVDGVQPAFVRDVNIRYLLGLVAYAAATLLAFASPVATVLLTVALALVFLLGPSPRSGLVRSEDR